MYCLWEKTAVVVSISELGHVCLWVCVCVFVCTCMCECMQCMHTCVYMHEYVCVDMCACVCVCIQCMHACVYICMYVCVDMCACVCVCACSTSIHVCLWIVCVLCVHMCVSAYSDFWEDKRCHNFYKVGRHPKMLIHSQSLYFILPDFYFFVDLIPKNQFLCFYLCS